jgi:hypothetical protein
MRPADVGKRELAGRVGQACVTALDVEGAAVSLLTTSIHRQALSTTDSTAATLEDLQFALGEGVCIEAAVSGRPVLGPDLQDHVLTTRWPVFAAAVAEQTEVRALFALPLRPGTINLGVLNLYRSAPGPLRGHELRDVVAAVDVTIFMLLLACGPDRCRAPQRRSTTRRTTPRRRAPRRRAPRRAVRGR